MRDSLRPLTRTVLARARTRVYDFPERGGQVCNRHDLRACEVPRYQLTLSPPSLLLSSPHWCPLVASHCTLQPRVGRGLRYRAQLRSASHACDIGGRREVRPDLHKGLADLVLSGWDPTLRRHAAPLHSDVVIWD